MKGMRRKGGSVKWTPRTEVQKRAQAFRTHRNKVKKYTKLLLLNPNSPHIGRWRENLEHSKNRVEESK